MISLPNQQMLTVQIEFILFYFVSTNSSAVLALCAGGTDATVQFVASHPASAPGAYWHLVSNEQSSGKEMQSKFLNNLILNTWRREKHFSSQENFLTTDRKKPSLNDENKVVFCQESYKHFKWDTDRLGLLMFYICSSEVYWSCPK